MKPSRDILDAQISYILQAPKDRAMIQQLCYRPDFGARCFVDKLAVSRDYGVEGCRWSHSPWLKRADGSGDPRIQVSILQQRVLDLIYDPIKSVKHPGDTFIVDMDLSYENLPVGTILQAGSAHLRVSDYFNNACVKWKTRYGEDALDWVRDDAHIKYRLRGVLCEVIKDGVIENNTILKKYVMNGAH